MILKPDKSDCMRKDLADPSLSYGCVPSYWYWRDFRCVVDTPGFKNRGKNKFFSNFLFD